MPFSPPCCPPSSGPSCGSTEPHLDAIPAEVASQVGREACSSRRRHMPRGEHRSRHEARGPLSARLPSARAATSSSCRLTIRPVVALVAVPAAQHALPRHALQWVCGAACIRRGRAGRPHCSASRLAATAADTCHAAAAPHTATSSPHSPPTPRSSCRSGSAPRSAGCSAGSCSSSFAARSAQPGGRGGAVRHGALCWARRRLPRGWQAEGLRPSSPGRLQRQGSTCKGSRPRSCRGAAPGGLRQAQQGRQQQELSARTPAAAAAMGWHVLHPRMVTLPRPAASAGSTRCRRCPAPFSASAPRTPSTHSQCLVAAFSGS